MFSYFTILYMKGLTLLQKTLILLNLLFFTRNQLRIPRFVALFYNMLSAMFLVLSLNPLVVKRSLVSYSMHISFQEISPICFLNLLACHISLFLSQIPFFIKIIILINQIFTKVFFHYSMLPFLSFSFLSLFITMSRSLVITLSNI